VRLRLRGQVSVVEVTHIAHDVLIKVVYISVVANDGMSYHSIPHHKFEKE